MEKSADSLPSIRVAGPEDLDALVELEHAVARDLPSADMFVVDERDFYEPLVQGGGQVLLATCGEQLVGAGIVAFPDSAGADNMGRELHFPASLLERVVHIESVYILPSFRGRKLAQRMTALNLELAARHGRDLALSTVWPGNASSMRFLYELGLTVRKLTRKYGGLDRFIMLRTPEDVSVCGETLSVPCLDMEGHRKQLARGMIGVGIRRHAHSRRDEAGNLAFSVLYRALCRDALPGCPRKA